MARTAIGFAFLIAGFLWAWPILLEMSAADRCEEAAGSYDYLRGQCDFNGALHPSLPLWQRHGVDLVSSFALGQFGLFLILRRRA